MDFDGGVWPAGKKVQNLTDFSSNVGAEEADSLTKMFISLVFYLYYSSYLDSFIYYRPKYCLYRQDPN